MQDHEYKYSLNSCGVMMKNWKRWYCRKNSKKEVKFMTRINHTAEFQIVWKRFLELWIDGKMVDQTLITPEAYDTLTRKEKDLPTESYPGLTFTTLFTFTPSIKANEKK